MKAIFVTQDVDPASPVLGATVAKIRALASRVDEVVVIANAAVAGALPANCTVELFASGSQAGRGLRYETALGRQLRAPRATFVLAHMCPIYAVLAAPFARPLRVPILLWFTHWRESRLLHLAERVSSAVVTVEPRSFPFVTSKLAPIGHGIDLAEFACVERRPHPGPLRVAALGRTSPAKGLEVVVEAVASVPDVRLTIAGPSLTSEERAHRSVLEERIARLGASSRVVLEGPIPRDRIPAFLASVDVLVNNMKAGATDKIVYEAAATCLPVLASNPALDGFLPDELRFERDDARSLAHRLEALVQADRAAFGRDLRARVERDHDVDGWAERLLEVARRHLR
ncbi:MAG: glycosyltransferase family 4 protein [Gaiellales bacterium]